MNNGLNYNWIVFRIGDKVLCKYSVKGTFLGEMAATLELLAFEQGVNPEDITIKLEV